MEYESLRTCLDTTVMALSQMNAVCRSRSWEWAFLDPEKPQLQAGQVKQLSLLLESIHCPRCEDRKQGKYIVRAGSDGLFCTMGCRGAYRKQVSNNDLSNLLKLAQGIREEALKLRISILQLAKDPYFRKQCPRPIHADLLEALKLIEDRMTDSERKLT